VRVRVGGVDALVRETVGCGSSVASSPPHPPPTCLPASQAKLAKMGFMLQQRPVPLDNIYTAAQAQVAYLVRAAPHQTPAHPNPNPSQALGPRARPRH
jgi:hypothetical protein